MYSMFAARLHARLGLATQREETVGTHNTQYGMEMIFFLGLETCFRLPKQQRDAHDT